KIERVKHLVLRIVVRNVGDLRSSEFLRGTEQKFFRGGLGQVRTATAHGFTQLLLVEVHLQSDRQRAKHARRCRATQERNQMRMNDFINVWLIARSLLLP